MTPTWMPLTLSILGGTWMLAKAEMPSPRMGRRTKSETSVIMSTGVEMNWYRASKGRSSVVLFDEGAKACLKEVE